LKNTKRYFVDLFAGCGGLSLGLENAGFTPLLVNELADEARATYIANRTEFKHLDESLVDELFLGQPQVYGLKQSIC
jgi:site-specific DNA-cytosine methylase